MLPRPRQVRVTIPCDPHNGDLHNVQWDKQDTSNQTFTFAFRTKKQEVKLEKDWERLRNAERASGTGCLAFKDPEADCFAHRLDLEYKGKGWIGIHSSLYPAGPIV